VTEAHGCEQLAQSCYSVADWPGVELATFRSRANAITTEPPSHRSQLVTAVASRLLDEVEIFTSTKRLFTVYLQYTMVLITSNYV